MTNTPAKKEEYDKHVLSNEFGVSFKSTRWVESRRQDHWLSSLIVRECLVLWLANKAHQLKYLVKALSKKNAP